MTTPVPRHRDLRLVDLVFAGLVASGVLAASAFALSAVDLGQRADAPSIDPGIGTPIAITPVPDLPPGHDHSASGVAPRIPERWRRKQPPPSKAATPSTVVAPAPRERRPTAPTHEAWALPQVSEEPPSEGPDSADAEAQPHEQPASVEGAEGGGEDRLEGRAVAAYRSRLTRWLSARFRVTGSGLGREDLLRYRVRATIEIAEGGRVSSYSIAPSGNAHFDRAAREALDSIVGEQVPSPPDDYPGALQSTVRTTFVCKESTCD